MRPARILPLLPLFILAACSGSSGPAEIRVLDSSGIAIIEHPAGAIAAAPVWRLGEPEVTIGGGEGEDQEFSFIGGAARLTDGRILLADNETGGTRFLVYGADGAFERRLGRSGEGPGEFRNASILGHLGDTLILYDFMAARVTRMNADGELLGTTDLARLGPMKLGMPTGVLADGRLLTSPIPFGDTAQRGSGPYRQESAVQLIDPAAMTLDTLQAFPGTEVKLSAMTLGGQSRSFPMPLGYGRRTLYGNGPDRIYVATNETAEVASYGLPWTTLRLTRFADRAQPVDQAARDAQIAEGLANIERSRQLPEEFKESMRENIRNASFADSLPHFTTMVVGADGSLWLRQARSAADSVPHYIIVGPDGRLAGRLDLPVRGRFLWTDGARALISTMDENDLPRLELRPVTKGAAAP